MLDFSAIVYVCSGLRGWKIVENSNNNIKTVDFCLLGRLIEHTGYVHSPSQGKCIFRPVLIGIAEIPISYDQSNIQFCVEKSERKAEVKRPDSLTSVITPYTHMEKKSISIEGISGFPLEEKVNP